jgi:hypothetical protein
VKTPLGASFEEKSRAGTNSIEWQNRVLPRRRTAKKEWYFEIGNIKKIVNRRKYGRVPASGSIC